MDSPRKLFNTPTLIHLVRVGRLELPASCSQSKRATNCATPGYEVFQLWSNMGSAPVFDQFPARGKTPSALASQSFPGFWRSVARTPASRSQSKRATNCATSGYLFLAEKRNFAVPVKIPAEHGQGHRGMYAGGDMLSERFQYHSMEEKKKQGFPPADHSRLEKAGSANKKAAHAGRQPCRTLRKYAAKAGGEVSGPGSKRDEPKDLCNTQGMRDLGY